MSKSFFKITHSNVARRVFRRTKSAESMVSSNSTHFWNLSWITLGDSDSAYSFLPGSQIGWLCVTVVWMNSSRKCRRIILRSVFIWSSVVVWLNWSLHSCSLHNPNPAWQPSYPVLICRVLTLQLRCSVQVCCHWICTSSCPFVLCTLSFIPSPCHLPLPSEFFQFPYGDQLIAG